MPTFFDVVAFAKALKISVLEIEMPNEDISGFIIKSEDNLVSACVNVKNKPREKRFTLAHEIGHYFMHNDKLTAGLVDTLKSDNTVNKVENEANEFAYNLLMPEDKFLKLWKDKTKDVSDMCDAFGVSEMTLITRAGDLNCLNERLEYQIIKNNNGNT